MARTTSIYRMLHVKMVIIKSVKKLLFVIGVCSITLLLWISYTSKHSLISIDKTDYGTYDQQFIKQLPQRSVLRKGNVTVLLWTALMKDTMWTDFYGDFTDHKCVKKCKFTFNRKLYDKSDLVIFNARRLYQDRNMDMLPLHLKREHDIWMLQGTEPPWKIYLDFKNVPNIFNWTSFPRPDSDVRTYYSKYESLYTKEMARSNRLFTETIEHFRRRTKMIGWVVSNCHSENKREEYAKRIMEYAPLEINGLCMNNSAKLGGDRDLGQHQDIIKQYKFFLAFENGNCRGYITEKFWNCLRQGAIPIVMGDSEAYKLYAPPGSYIDTSWFDTPADLVKYINKVAQNESLYRSYFEWIRRYKITNSYWCDVCTAVHNWNGVHQVYTDIHGWYAQDTCDLWTLSGFMRNVMEELGRIFYNPTPFPSLGFWWRFSLGPIASPVSRPEKERKLQNLVQEIQEES